MHVQVLLSSRVTRIPPTRALANDDGDGHYNGERLKKKDYQLLKWNIFIYFFFLVRDRRMGVRVARVDGEGLMEREGMARGKTKKKKYLNKK